MSTFVSLRCLDAVVSMENSSYAFSGMHSALKPTEVGVLCNSLWPLCLSLWRRVYGRSWLVLEGRIGCYSRGKVHLKEEDELFASTVSF